jgi:hypothetical protein
VNLLLQLDSNLCHGESVKTSSSIDEISEYAQSCLDAVMEAVWKDDEHNEFCGGANSYKQLMVRLYSYLKLNHIIIVVQNLLIIFSWNLSALSNFKKKVQLQEKTKSRNNSSKDPGHKPRPSFNLGSHHPLYTSHVWVILMKMCMPMLAGVPSPKFSVN